MSLRTRPILMLMMATAGIVGGAGIVHAQWGGALPSLPSPGGALSSLGLPKVADVLEPVDTLARATTARLESLRRQTFAQLVRDNPDAIALDPQGFPARAGEVVVDAPSDTLIAEANKAGYAIIERDDVLGVGFVRLRVPQGVSLKKALDQLRTLGGEVSADQLHLASGGGVALVAPPLAGQAAKVDTVVGVIDGGVEGAAMLRGFASGAPRPNDHGTAVASLIAGGCGIRGALPGARIASADVYGTDPAGGNATAIAKALGWLVGARVPVVTISLVGPSNPLLARVVAAAQARGTIIVAAVGNNGAASPPAYPASYPGVIAVSGVDRRNRPLIEAGRAEHLDYVAPAADMLAAGVNGRRFAVRGTSFAAPLVAGRIAAVYPTPDPAQVRAALAKIDAEARRAGLRGPEKNVGRGMICGDCRTNPQIKNEKLGLKAPAPSLSRQKLRRTMMKNFLSGTAILAVALVASPVSAQLLGGGGLASGVGGQLGGVTGGATGGLTGNLDSATRSGQVATDNATRARGAARADRNVDLRRGRVGASGNATGNSTVDSATQIGGQSGGATASNTGSLGGSVDAQLVGTNAVRDAAGRGVNAVGNVAERTRNTAGTVVERTRGTVGNVANRAANLGGNAAGSASGAASATGGHGSVAGNLALAGSGAAQGGAFPVNAGMAVTDAQGRAIGAVQSVRTNAQGAVERVLVKVGDRVANLPAANFSGSGSALVSAMGQGDVSSAAK